MGTPRLVCRELFQKNLLADQRLQEASLLKAAAAEETRAAEEVKCQAASQTAALDRREAVSWCVPYSALIIYIGGKTQKYIYCFILLYIMLYYVMLCYVISCCIILCYICV